MGDAGPRRQAREAALQVLYAADATGRLSSEEIPSVFREISQEFALPRRARERAERLCLGVIENLERIDDAIASASPNWKLHRLATVDRNVLRIAAFELVFEDWTPGEVIIDEAVEVVRRYSDESSFAFVNGVLETLWRREREQVRGSPERGGVT